MVFKFTTKTEPLYNNTGFYKKWDTYEGLEDRVCYSYMRFNKQSVAVLNPVIDTLRFTLDTKDIELRKIIHDKMSGLGELWEPTKEHFEELKFSTYKKRRYVKGFPSSIVLLATELNNSKNNFLQIGLHASAFSKNDIKELYSLLNDLSNGYWTPEKIYKESSIIRMDWCVDFMHINPHELGMWKASGTRGSKHFIHKGLGNTGLELEAKHAEKGKKHKKGKHNASKAYYYDKNHQSKLNGKEATRFEFRTFKEDTSISDNINSDGKKGVFKPYEVLDFAAIKPKEFSDHEWLSFGDSCKMRTRDHAISILPVHLQETATATLKNICDRVWRHEELKKAMEKEKQRFKFH